MVTYVTMLQVYKPIRYLLVERCIQCRRAAFCHLEKPVEFEFSPGIVFGADCPLGYIAVAACYCPSRVGWPSSNVIVARFLSVSLEGLMMTLSSRNM